MDQARRILVGGWVGGLPAISPFTDGYYTSVPSAALEADVAGFGYIYGLHEIRLVSADGLITASLPVSQALTWNERLAKGELNNRYGLARVDAVLDGIEWSLEAGGISLQAHAMMLGATIQTSGLSPNREQRINRQRGAQMPYFKIYGKAFGDQSDGLYILLKKCKVTTLQGKLGSDGFYITKCSGVGVADATGSLYEIIKAETAGSLPVV